MTNDLDWLSWEVCFGFHFLDRRNSSFYMNDKHISTSTLLFVSNIFETYIYMDDNFKTNIKNDNIYWKNIWNKHNSSERVYKVPIDECAQHVTMISP